MADDIISVSDQTVEIAVTFDPPTGVVVQLSAAEPGVNGTDGTNGTNGTNGIPGPQGPPGDITGNLDGGNF